MNAIIAFRDENVKKAMDAFCEHFGGGIGLFASYGYLAYMTPDKNTTYLQPGDETAEKFVEMLQESVKIGKNLILERWKLFVSPGSGVLY